MQEFKITHYETNTGMVFPHFESIDAEMAYQIRQRLAQRLGFDFGTQSLDLLNQIGSSSAGIMSFRSDDEPVNLRAVLQMHGVRPNDEVFINWYRFDDIDKMSLRDLSDHFSDIWYPSSDDIEIFDASLDWILSVNHHGSLSLCHLADTRQI